MNNRQQSWLDTCCARAHYLKHYTQGIAIKLITLLFLVLTTSVNANEITLPNGQSYTVPEGKVWVIENAPMSECRVCTADVYVKGAMSQVEINGIIFNGTFNFSFSNKNNGVIKLYPGTVFFLGDSRPTLKISEQNQ